jgi:hypothetical protein
VARVLDEDELIEHRTLVGADLNLLTGRTGPSKPRLALWLKFAPGRGSSSGREVKASVPVSSHDLLTVVTYLSSVRMREGM